MLDNSVRAGEDQPGVAVVEAHKVRRRASGSMHLDDLARVFGLAHDLAVHMQSVADSCLHGAHLLVLCKPRHGCAASAASCPYTP
jgi:hypothetical protein